MKKPGANSLAFGIQHTLFNVNAQFLVGLEAYIEHVSLIHILPLGCDVKNPVFGGF